MERVLWPMEPVEPRIASFFTDAIFADSKMKARGGTPFLESAKSFGLLSQPSNGAIEGWLASWSVDDDVGGRAA